MPIPLQVGHAYTRAQIAVELAEPRITTHREGPLYIDAQRVALLFVTLDKDNAAEGQRYNDWFEGNVFHWDSQNAQHLQTRRIQDLVNGILETHLLVRVQQRLGSERQPFLYAGQLEYLAAVAGTANPVHLTWIASDFQEHPNDDLSAIYEWRPEIAGHHADVPPVAELQVLPRGQGRQANAEVRRAVELWAMEVAAHWYAGEGYDVENTSATRPYDLVCRRGGETIRVEVKGSVGTAATVIVTRNEVRAARLDAVPTDLFVLSEIRLELDEGELAAHGGNIRRIQNWVPTDDQLDPVAFDFRLPLG